MQVACDAEGDERGKIAGEKAILMLTQTPPGSIL